MVVVRVADVVVRVVGFAAGREAWYTNCAKSEISGWIDAQIMISMP